MRVTAQDPVPATFTACTVKVTATPLVSPVSVVEVAGGFGATPLTVAALPAAPKGPSPRRRVIRLPPLEAGACHDTAAWLFPGTAGLDALVGAPGSVGPEGVTDG